MADRDPVDTDAATRVFTEHRGRLYGVAYRILGRAVNAEDVVQEAVVGWANTHLPGRPIVARVRPDNVASARVATRVGLRRAEQLDTMGEDGLDWIFTTNWPTGPA